MKTREFIETTSHFKDSELFKDILDKEVVIQLHNTQGVLISDHFECTRVGSKFNPFKGTSSLVIDITIL